MREDGLLLQEQLLVQPGVKFAVRVDIRHLLADQPIAICALPVRISVTPPLQQNTISLTIVPFAVLANIRQPPEDKPIVTKVALPARILVTAPLQQNTITLTIVQFAVRVHIRLTLEEPPIAFLALPAHISVILTQQSNTMD
jgi:hypothetical protein